MKQRRQKGSVTIFLCILLSVMIPLTGILVDLVRYRLADGQVREAMRLTADSLLAGYDRPLREEYGLFSLALTDRNQLEEKASSILSANLAPMKLEGVSDLYGFKVIKLQVIPLQNLTESAVLERQVAEFMKYRAPIQMATGFLEKIKAFSGAVEETTVIQADMALDRELAAIRSDLVHLSMLRAKMETIGSEPMKGIRNLRKELERNRTTIFDAVREHASLYRLQADAMNLLLPKLRVLAIRCASASAVADEAEKQAEAADEAVKISETAWTKSKGKTAESDALALELAAAASVANAKRLVANQLRQDKGSASVDLDQMRQAQWNPLLEKGTGELENISELLAENLSALMQLDVHVNRHLSYLKKGAALAESLEKKLYDLKARVDATGIMANNAGGKAGSTTGTLKATLAAQPVLPGVSSVQMLTGQLRTALERVSAWSAATLALTVEAESLLRDAENTGVGFRAVSADPEKGSGMLPYLSFPMSSGENEGSGLLTLGGFGTYGEMQPKGIYFLPDCSVNPTPSEAEREECREWFSSWSGEPAGDEENGKTGITAKEKQAARKTLGSLRAAAGETARNIQDGDETKIINEAVFDEEEAAFLPSGSKGKADSAAALAEIDATLLSAEAYIDYILPLAVGNAGEMNINEKTENFFTRGLDRVTETARQLGTAMLGAPESFMESLYLNAYILSAFKNQTTTAEGIEQEIGWGRNSEDTAFSKGETEYVLFGSPIESDNLAAMKRSLFATRMAMNLLHVYTTPAKESATLALATTLAGWTVFGIPVVQNFLMISWAAAESCVDLDKLCRGEAIPLVKTTSTWYLDPGSVRDSLVQKLLISPTKQMVAKTSGNMINAADEAVQETVGGWVDAGVDEVFAPLELKCMDFGQAASDAILNGTETIPSAIMSNVSTLMDSLPVSESAGPMMERFEGVLSIWMDTLRKTCAETVKLESSRQVTALRESVKTEIRIALFNSPFYNELVTQARKTASDLVDTGFDALGRQADNLFGAGSGMRGMKAGISGRVMTMDYGEYAAMYLLLVPEKVKTSRVADLMQLNLAGMVPEVQSPMKNRNTAIYLRAEVSMDFWFFPDQWLKKAGFGLIQAEWGQGY